MSARGKSFLFQRIEWETLGQKNIHDDNECVHFMKSDYFVKFTRMNSSKRKNVFFVS